MERVRIEEFGEFKDEDYGFGQRFPLKILPGNSLHFMGIRIFIVGCMRNAKRQFQPYRAFWRLNLATGMSSKFELRANCLARLKVLSYSTPVVVTLPLRASHVCHSGDLPVVRSSRETPLNCTLLEISSHSLTHYPCIILT